MAERMTSIVKGCFRRRLAVYLFVTIVFAAGVVAGALAVNRVTEVGRLALIAEVQSLLEHAEGRRVASSGVVVQRALTEYGLKLLGVIGLAGLSVIGAPVILAVMFGRGFVLGFTAGFLVDRLLLRGALLALVALLPQNLLAVPAIIFAGAGAVSFSVAAAMVLLGRRDINMYQQFAGTGLVMIIASALLVAAAFVEAYVSPVLIDATSRWLM